MSRGAAVGFTVGLFAPWVAWFVFWPLAVVIWVPVAVWLLSRRWWWPLLSGVLTPGVVVPTVSATSGVVSYATGTATLRTFGMPDPEFFNLDPELRLRWSTSGCVVDGTEWLRDEPNNLVVRGLVAVLGPQPGAYTGPLPDRAAAWAAADLGATELEGLDLRVDQGSVALVRPSGEIVALYARR